MNSEELNKLFIKIKSDKKTMLILIVGLIGMLLVMLSDSENNKPSEIKDNNNVFLSERELAYDVEKFIENIEGAGKTDVILSFESLEETIYAQDTNSKINGNVDIDTETEYVIIDKDDGEGGLLLKVISPKVRGVAVLCKGGNNPVVKEQIIMAVSALFDISTNKISVATMAD